MNAVNCGSGLVSRKGCKAAPAIYVFALNPWGCLAALSRHKAAPTTDRAGWNIKVDPLAIA
ncbi:hypothetical protein DBB42_21120 [Pseudomonas plecoglossicida]|uniref:Uncharacterized protein n=1 Tax=Pseudomonas plecoglossicida TaxID=70775 RepID=A0A2R7UFW3_PSEDL|nr:hypothetical protein DBB42_21120 [Pseudomonas plecoglossicida]